MYSDSILSGVNTSKIFVEKVVKPNVLKQQPDEDMVDMAVTKSLPTLLEFLNNEVENKQWFVGNSFSAADIAISTQLLALEMSGYTLSESEFPHLYKFYNGAKARKSFEKFIV